MEIRFNTNRLNMLLEELPVSVKRAYTGDSKKLTKEQLTRMEERTPIERIPQQSASEGDS